MGEIYPDLELSDIKKQAKVCNGSCLGPLYAGNTYFITPYTCCEDQISTCLCLGQDMAFPCTDNVPMTCSLLPCECPPT